ncbi:MAG TPA: cupredoxin domain-containing protein [Candidatus Acidoferrales bacterium]|nr:cupredoxin domain-containing protein [Candidatus Acidoferrales bacterium]
MRVALPAALALLIAASGFVSAGPRRQAAQNPQVIQVTAKKYSYSPDEIHVRQGARVQLKFTATDHTHGFSPALYPEGSDKKGAPGIVLATPQKCFRLEKGQTTTVEFTAVTPGTYTFKCCVRCGFGHGGMKGKIIVEP